MCSMFLFTYPISLACDKIQMFRQYKRMRIRICAANQWSFINICRWHFQKLICIISGIACVFVQNWVFVLNPYLVYKNDVSMNYTCQCFASFVWSLFIDFFLRQLLWIGMIRFRYFRWTCFVHMYGSVVLSF